ncbi:MAG: DUF1592 domain-containing protein [Myxococcales bacterium]|nr:DUF1592 domain-containing protein [Myxococcota bacterium]MDW8282220.1 DUF1592 domain-containing protein [Myxococcales bacterium]
MRCHCLLLLGLAACGGAVLEGEPAGRLGPDITPAPATLHRLTSLQYQNTVRDLFGSWIQVPTDLDVDTPLHGYRSIGASALTISERAAEQYEAAALSLARQVFGDAARRQALLGCAPSAPDDACARSALLRLGRRVWRRPLQPDELEGLLRLSRQVAASLQSNLAGLEYATAALLQSPHFLFRVERGEPDPEHPGSLRYTAYEMASRLSYFLWNSGPDEALLDAAERGELLHEAGLRTQTARLLAAPPARAALAGFFAELFALERLGHVVKDAALFPQFRPSLVEAMRQEVLRQVDELVFVRNGDYRDLLDGDITFVNGELARLYGLPGVSGPDLVRTQLPAGRRAGLLGTAAVLSLHAHATLTSPTLRGKFVRQQLLCQDIPPPPPGVTTSLPPPTGRPQTVRERLAQHRQDPACRSCHERMDPLGLGLEHFDPIGAFRTQDNGLPVDGRGDLDGTPFEGPRELGRLLRGHAAIGLCLVRQLYRHATGHLESAAEEAGVQALWQRFVRGHNVKELVYDLVLSDGFRRASAPQ